MSNPDHTRVADAVRQAETSTSGEIYCVLAGSSDSYFFPAALMLSVGMVVASALAAFVLHWYWIDVDLRTFAGAQLAALATAYALLWLAPGLRIVFVPKSLRFRRAHANAVRQFLAHNIHTTEARTGVLLFVSMAEHYAEVVADEGINSKVDQDRWNAIVAILIEHARKGKPVDGFVAAVAEAGGLLAEHFPPKPDDRNELDDRLVQI